MVLINVAKTGERIHTLMKDRGISPNDIKRACGLTTTNVIYKWVHGKHLPSIENMVEVARLLGVTVDEILVLEERA